MKKNFLILAIAVSACTGLFALYHLYQNSKTDGFDRGSIEVIQCREKDWNWKVYECIGDYTSGVGMMGKNNVSVTVTGDEHHKGGVINDVYPPVFHSKMDTNQFVTGKERSSILYNSPWLLLLFASIITPICAVLYIFGERRKSSSL